MSQTRYLILENGKVFSGKSFGAVKECTGEVVFQTSMCGYLETLTDPNYYGQIVVQTFPMIGNYGVIPSDLQSDSAYPSAYIVREWCEVPSNFRSMGELDAFLQEKGIPGLYDLDTRELTKYLRDNGTMKGCVCDEPDLTAAQEKMKQYRIQNAVAAVANPSQETSTPKNHCCKLVLWDFGSFSSLLAQLLQRECQVIRMPYSSTAQEISGLNPDGVVLSDGPGDPAENIGVISELALLCGKNIPIFAVGLGHQLLALSQGGETEKLKYGHRGANHPCKFLPNGRVYVTTQNHGYTVSSVSLPRGSRITFSNLNDGSCEGLEYHNIPAFSVQFQPQEEGGEQDTSFLFDRFLSLLK